MAAPGSTVVLNDAIAGNTPAAIPATISNTISAAMVPAMTDSHDYVPATTSSLGTTPGSIPAHFMQLALGATRGLGMFSSSGMAAHEESAMISSTSRSESPSNQGQEQSEGSRGSERSAERAAGSSTFDMALPDPAFLASRVTAAVHENGGKSSFASGRSRRTAKTSRNFASMKSVERQRVGAPLGAAVLRPEMDFELPSMTAEGRTSMAAVPGAGIKLSSKQQTNAMAILDLLSRKQVDLQSAAAMFHRLSIPIAEVALLLKSVKDGSNTQATAGGQTQAPAPGAPAPVVARGSKATAGSNTNMMAGPLRLRDQMDMSVGSQLLSCKTKVARARDIRETTDALMEMPFFGGGLSDMDAERVSSPRSSAVAVAAAAAASRGGGAAPWPEDGFLNAVGKVPRLDRRAGSPTAAHIERVVHSRLGLDGGSGMSRFAMAGRMQAAGVADSVGRVTDAARSMGENVGDFGGHEGAFNPAIVADALLNQDFAKEAFNTQWMRPMSMSASAENNSLTTGQASANGQLLSDLAQDRLQPGGLPFFLGQMEHLAREEEQAQMDYGNYFDGLMIQSCPSGNQSAASLQNAPVSLGTPAWQGLQEGSDSPDLLEFVRAHTSSNRHSDPAIPIHVTPASQDLLRQHQRTLSDPNLRRQSQMSVMPLDMQLRNQASPSRSLVSSRTKTLLCTDFESMFADAPQAGADVRDILNMAPQDCGTPRLCLESIASLWSKLNG